MKSHQYLAIGFRLLAIVIFIYSLRQIATLISVAFYDTYGGMQTSPLFFLVMAIIPLIVAFLLWVFPTTIAKKVVPPESEVSVVPEKSFSILIALILTVGLFTFFYAAIDGIYWLTYLHLMSSTPEAYDRTSEVIQNNRATILATAFEFVAALVIILRARYIANFLYRVAR
jgi:hypothetical protein